MDKMQNRKKYVKSTVLQKPPGAGNLRRDRKNIKTALTISQTAAICRKCNSCVRTRRRHGPPRVKDPKLAGGSKRTGRSGDGKGGWRKHEYGKTSLCSPCRADCRSGVRSSRRTERTAHAIGDDGGGGGGGKPSCSSFGSKNACQAQAHCYWSSSKNKCRTKKNQLSGASDDTKYVQAVSLIGEGEYSDALRILWSIGKRDDPKVLNYIGYSTRKLGNVKKGIEYYHQALKLDPDYVRAREYLGEGYLQIGDLDKAREQLTEIARRCGTDCLEYKKLTLAIVFHVTGEKPDDTW